MSYANLLVETRASVGLIVLNRPDALNALSLDLREELADALDRMEADATIGAVSFRWTRCWRRR